MEKYSIEEVCESYINGNLSHVKQQIDDNLINLVELFEYYLDKHHPPINEIKLFIIRLY